jgi:hypothetical protein
MDELLDFLESPRRSLKKEVLDVVDQTLAVSPTSLEMDRRPVALLKRLVTPNDAEVFELIETGRGSTWKFEVVREVATTRKSKISYKASEKEIHTSFWGGSSCLRSWLSSSNGNHWRFNRDGGIAGKPLK